MKSGKNFLVILLLIVLVLSGIGTANGEILVPRAYASEKKEVKNISITAFVKKLEKAAGLEPGTLLQEGEFANREEKVTWTQAAVLANRADEMKNGTGYDKELYKEVVKGKRLTGLKGLSAKEKKAVRLCFVKGIIAGDSKGNYSQSRAIHANGKITKEEARKICRRVKREEKRVKLSRDGQVIRTKNLPSNYKEYDYILESFPNEFYERTFRYEMTTYYYEPKNLEDYACPKDVKRMKYQWSSQNEETGEQMYENYGEVWMETIRTNLECRFNFDYRTVDDKWISNLAGTYIYDDDAEWNRKINRVIKNYVETAKKNHVIVEADKIVVEPSTLYYSNGEFYVRCYLKFKVNADVVYDAKIGQENRQHELIFSSYNAVGLENLKKNQWYEMSIDVAIGQTAGNQNPETYSIQVDQIWPWK